MPEAGGLNAKLENTRKLLTPGNINQPEIMQKPPYLHWTKLHPRANKFQSKTYHGNSPAMQEHSSVQSLSHVRLFVTPLLQHTRPPCPSLTPGVHSDSRSSSQWCHPAISSSVVPFSSCPQSLPASKSFPMSQLFAWGGQSTGVSPLASFLPKKSQVDLLQNTYVSKAGKSHQYILWGILPKVFISVGNKM